MDSSGGVDGGGAVGRRWGSGGNALERDLGAWNATKAQAQTMARCVVTQGRLAAAPESKITRQRWRSVDHNGNLSLAAVQRRLAIGYRVVQRGSSWESVGDAHEAAQAGSASLEGVPAGHEGCKTAASV